ncbi:MAG: hypothetical protein K9J30_07085 [Bacteroidales bacterium]|nr:hypothetical protein [Bacteroidales bacterium]
MKTTIRTLTLSGRMLIPAISIILILGLQSCTQYEIVPPEVGYESFSTSIQPIFNNDCVDCHSGNLDPNLSEGNSYLALTTGGYIDTDDPGSSLIMTMLEGSHKSYTSASNKELILEWITAGAPND